MLHELNKFLQGVLIFQIFTYFLKDLFSKVIMVLDKVSYSANYETESSCALSLTSYYASNRGPLGGDTV